MPRVSPVRMEEQVFNEINLYNADVSPKILLILYISHVSGTKLVIHFKPFL